MNLPDTQALNLQFSFQQDDQQLQFIQGEGDIPRLTIKNRQATAVISLQGAHLLSWIPTGEDDVIWLSPDATFAKGKSVRGGIPICWPWFGAHESNTAYPAHGFARTVLWQVKATQALPSGETKVTFVLDTTRLDENTRAMWPLPIVVEYSLVIGKTLTMELTTANNSDQSMMISQALHTYFKVADVSTTQVIGLDGRDYLDKTAGYQLKTQTGVVTIDAEIDRVYLQTPDEVTIDDGQRRISIRNQGSHSTVVWNPWQAVAEKMGDLGSDGYLNMLCVESANAMEDSVQINAGAQHTLWVRYALDK